MSIKHLISLILLFLVSASGGSQVTSGPACVPCYVITSPLPSGPPVGSIIVTIVPATGTVYFDCSYLHALSGYANVKCPQAIAMPVAPVNQMWGGNAWQNCVQTTAPVQGCWWGFSFWSQ